MHILCTGFLAIALATANTQPQARSHNLDNANHIFNAVHSAMRQWGSSLNHNGMSLFIATVPEGTELYHGTSEAHRVNRTDWLAFEPEHALGFARPRGRGPPGKGGPPGGPPRPEQELFDGGNGPERAEESAKYWSFGHDQPRREIKARHPHEPQHDDRPLTHTAAQRERARMPQQTPLSNPELKPDSEDEAHGYLHTYKPKHDLRLIYIDGQSAAKSTKGTLDTQDVVLIHNNPPPKEDGDQRHSKNKDDNGKSRTGGPMNEAWRADKLCEMAEKDWRGSIHGFIRMELGFEIILCSFERDLNIERIAVPEGGGGQRRGPGHGDDGEQFSHYRAVASRFDGIGGDRVRVNYDRFVTLFASHWDAIIFDGEGHPRAVNDSNVLRPVQDAITEMVLHDDPKEPVNWQAIADMVIARYSDRIEYLASGDLDNLQSFQAEVNRALRPFIDYSKRDRSAEIRRCARQYIPNHNDSNSLAAQAITNVTTTLCASLSVAAASTDYAEAISYIRNLKAWLAWTSWKRCRGCEYDQVCFVPIWPMGGKAEFENPKCISDMADASRGYWGGFGGPRGPRKKDRRRE